MRERRCLQLWADQTKGKWSKNKLNTLMSDQQVVKVVLFVCSSVKVWIYGLMGIQRKFLAGIMKICPFFICFLDHLHPEIALRD